MTTTSAELNERRLEWAVATLALVGGCAISAIALSYGVSHSTGVGAGFLPLVAGIVLGLAALAWLTQLVMTRPAEGALATAGPGAVSETPVHQAEDRLDQLLEDAEVDETDEHSYPTALGWLRVATLAGSIAVAAILLNVLGYVLTMTGSAGHDPARDRTTEGVDRRCRRGGRRTALAADLRGLAGDQPAALHPGTVLDVGDLTWASLTCSTASPLF